MHTIFHKSLSKTFNILKDLGNESCAVLIYRSIHGNYFTEIKQICPSIRSFNKITLRLSKSPSPGIAYISHDALTRDSLFFNYTVCLWNSLPVGVFPVLPDVSTFKANGHKPYSFFPSFSTYNPNSLSSCLYV